MGRTKGSMELEGLTVAAVAGEAAKAAGAGAVEPAPDDGQGQATGAEEAGAAGAAAEVAAGVGEGQAADAGGAGETSAGLAPEVKALVEAQVAAAVEGVRKEYEGKDGHLSKLRSAKDKEMAKLRKELAEKEKADFQEALELARQDPGAATERLAGMVEGLQSRRQQEQQEAELQLWAAGVLDELGLDPDDEAVAEVAGRVGPLTSEGASYAYLGEMGKLAKEQEAAARKKLEKELASTMEGLPGLVQAAVAKQLAASGLGAVDGAEQQAPAQENPIKDIESPSRLLQMGWKKVGRKK